MKQLELMGHDMIGQITGPSALIIRLYNRYRYTIKILKPDKREQLQTKLVHKYCANRKDPPISSYNIVKTK